MVAYVVPVVIKKNDDIESNHEKEGSGNIYDCNDWSIDGAHCQEIYTKRAMVSVRENGTISFSTTGLLDTWYTMLQHETEQGGKSTTDVERSVSCMLYGMTR